MNMKTLLLAIFICLNGSFAMAQSPLEKFPYPSVPDSLRTPAKRAVYVMQHYWDRFDFNDTTLIHRPELTEQGFANFVDLLPRVEPATAALGLKAFVDHIYMVGDNGEPNKANERMREYFADLTEKYLGDSDSPLHNDMLYAQFLDVMSANKYASVAERTRNVFMAKNLRKNLPGSVAADFEYVGRDGSKHRMHDFNADYTLLYFYDPDCGHCHEVADKLEGMEQLMDSCRVRVLAIYPYDDSEQWTTINAGFSTAWTDGRSPEGKIANDDMYYFKSMPSIYLLDKEKRVLLKNPSIQLLQNTLTNLSQK